MTLKKLAALANVSITTASRALNDSCDVSPETREHVLKIAQSCGYFTEKKRVKSEYKNHKRITVAIICPEIISVHYSLIAEYLAREIEKNGSRCVIYCFRFDSTLLKETVTKCINDPECDALICLGGIDFDLENVDMPIISMGDYDACSHMHIDLVPAYSMMLDSLISEKRNRIAFAGEIRTEGKYAILKNQLKDRNMSIFAKFSKESRFERAGEEAAEYFLSLPIMPDAVVCAYDEIAFGLIHALSTHGINVPKDVSVTGTNDIPSAHCFSGGLSTVRIDFKKAADEMIQDILSLNKAKKEYTIHTKFIKRYT